jgi:hypothetical protein
MHRVLDIDLDFFVDSVAHWVQRDGARLPEDEYSSWSPEETMDFLRGRCHLTGKLPGWVIEHHDEAFARWRDAVGDGMLVPPFHVTHIDAHADLGLGDAGYVHLITEVMHRPVEERSLPEVVEPALGFGNWLAFAVACQWVSDLDYVFCPGGGDDVLGLYMSDDPKGLQLRAATMEQLRQHWSSGGDEPLQGEADPVVPICKIRAEDFSADGSYDAIVLCRSPSCTPASADEIFDLIRREFIEEIS